MKTYDIAFSLGAACSCSQALREAGLQFASYPLDWVGSPGILRSVEAIETGFGRWFEKADLQLIDVRREPLSTRCYRNRRTGFGFYHEFTLFTPFDALYPAVAEQFRRREDRLLSALRNARSALAVYVEVPFREQGTDADFVEAHRRLQSVFPETSFDLIAFRKGVSGQVKRELAPGVTVLEQDFVQYENGVVSHQVNRLPITNYLKDHCRVEDGRPTSVRADYLDRKRKERSERWKRNGAFSRFCNQISYRLYRDLSGYLETQGIIPRERPVRY